MPIVEIEIVVGEEETLPPTLASDLAEAIASVLRSPKGSTWVRLRVLPESRYAENGGDGSGAGRPIFASILKARLPDPADLEREAMTLAEVIARTCGRERECAHILYLPEAAGRIAFGGELLGREPPPS